MNRKKYTKNNPLRIGTDCSGIEAPIQALRQLKIPYVSVWCSDIDKYCIQSIKANYNPERIYGDKEGDYPDGDIRNRNHFELPDVDLYVCGFPCQPFSQAGKGEGLSDKRGNVFWSCIDVIRIKKPKYFILENVKGILWNDKKNKKDKYGNTWKVIWSEIEKLRDLGYHVDWRVMNTRHYGIPQNRERVYIVGTMEGEYVWPEKCEMKNILEYIDNNDKSQYTLQGSYNKLYDKVPQNAVFVDTSFCGRDIKYTYSYFYSGCINTKGGLYNMVMHRYANTKEHLFLQGFNIDFKVVVSNYQLKKQIGNSMSVNVLSAILNQLSDS